MRFCRSGAGGAILFYPLRSCGGERESSNRRGILRLGAVRPASTVAAARVVRDAQRRRGETWPAGLRRGDVILEVNQKTVANVAEFRGAMSEQEKALLLVRRGEATLFVAVKKKAAKE